MKVSHVQTIKAIFMPGHKQIDKTITAREDLTMTRAIEGVEVALRGKTYLIPWHMIECIVMAPLPVPTLVGQDSIVTPVELPPTKKSPRRAA